MGIILHVATKAGWEQAIAESEYRGDTLTTEGFIHCCLPDQLAGVIARYFPGRSGLVVLRIEAERLNAPLLWESPPGGDQKFPHVYGPVNRDAVVEIRPLDAALGG